MDEQLDGSRRPRLPGLEERLARRRRLYDTTPQPDFDVGPLLPDANRTGASIGAGFQLSHMFRVELSTLFIWFHERTTTTNENNFNGTYRVFAILPGIGIKSTF